METPLYIACMAILFFVMVLCMYFNEPTVDDKLWEESDKRSSDLQRVLQRRAKILKPEEENRLALIPAIIHINDKEYVDDETQSYQSAKVRMWSLNEVHRAMNAHVEQFPRIVGVLGEHESFAEAFMEIENHCRAAFIFLVRCCMVWLEGGWIIDTNYVSSGQFPLRQAGIPKLTQKPKNAVFFALQRIRRAQHALSTAYSFMRSFSSYGAKDEGSQVSSKVFGAVARHECLSDVLTRCEKILEEHSASTEGVAHNEGDVEGDSGRVHVFEAIGMHVGYLIGAKVLSQSVHKSLRAPNEQQGRPQSDIQLLVGKEARLFLSPV